ncbi:hypothetical protein A3F59_04375 [Candidatus Roizmanbacteria bacterium RIFCSPHIGHO2_12_FULL_38_13]|nr:MAG: hypothetical protein A3F59_04375 [Candidatus Roizmanbacteria bacterium RIFCSPHIGHO2_12_FULL_38_13]
MSLTHEELRKKFKSFWEKRGHKEVPPTQLVPQNDPTTLFTGSGMQQFVPNLLGEPHPLGTKLFNVQHCIRVQDIEEVGDNRHDTFFEMMGNWSLGDYFKKEQLNYFFTFLTDKDGGLGLEPKRLYVTAFEGNDHIPQDKESIEVWQEIFKGVGIEAKIGERIFLYDATKNWWSRAGVPENMPPGEPGGPDSEVFYQFDVPHDPRYGKDCHPNCNCGRFLEIGNSVFMEYKKLPDSTFEELPKKNVDFGGGLERFLAAAQNDPDIFKTDVFNDIVRRIELVTTASYSDPKNQSSIRIIADHIKTAVFIIKNGVFPSNKEHGYVLRRLLRRALLKLRSLKKDFKSEDVSVIARSVLSTYGGIYFDISNDESKVTVVVDEEMKKFEKSISTGMKLIEKMQSVDAKAAFDLYQTYGFPLELTEEILKERGHKIDRKAFYEEFNKHKELSRSSSAGKFKGGLADHSEQVIKYHTATHLLHQALFDVLGNDVKQAGSNITGERLRFDFSNSFTPTDEEIKKVEKIINEKINKALPVNFKIMPKSKADKVGARSFFKEKYGEQVKVYYIGETEKNIKDAYSKEFCGGPHVKNTKEISKLKIDKFKKIGSNLYRIYAI